MGFLTPNASGEHAVLRTFALQQLAQLRTTVHGLTDEQAASTPTASGLSLVALLRHCGGVAVYWSACAAAAPEPPSIPEDLAVKSLDELGGPCSLAEALDHLDRCVAVATENIDSVTDLAAPVPVPKAPWYPAGLTTWEARWCLTHLCTEVARHVGHADIIRESIDGAGSFDLNNRVDAEAQGPAAG